MAELLKGEFEALELDPVAAAILAVIRAPNPLGDFAEYQGVFELSIGLEGFTPAPGAQPTVGTRGAHTLSPTAIITTYFRTGADPGAVEAALDALLRAHPWETPVIEVTDAAVQLPERRLMP